MGIEYIVVCLRCHEWIDMGKTHIDMCDNFDDESEWFKIPYQDCEDEHCPYHGKRNSETIQRLEEFMELHASHEVLYIHEHESLYEFILHESDWKMFNPTEQELHWLMGVNEYWKAKMQFENPPWDIQRVLKEMISNYLNKRPCCREGCDDTSIQLAVIDEKIKPVCKWDGKLLVGEDNIECPLCGTMFKEIGE